ncbi:MAG: hypothetical protein VX223_14730 [Myxococcota bacterium]|nr:hypothetical protein [Myxococcota bacterium]
MLTVEDNRDGYFDGGSQVFRDEPTPLCQLLAALTRMEHYGITIERK